MFSPHLLGVLLAATVAGILATVVARAWKPSAGIAMLFALVTLGQLVMRPGESVKSDGTLWLGYLAGLGALLFLLNAFKSIPKPDWSSLVFYVFISVGLLAGPLIRPAGVIPTWWATLPYFAVLTIATLLHDRIIDRQNPRLAVLTVPAWSAGIAVAIAASGSIRLFEIISIFTAAMAGATLFTLVRPSALPGLGASSTLMLGWLLLAALWYADLTRVAAALLLAAPLGLGLAHAGRTPRSRAILAAVGVLTLLGAAVAWTLIYGQPAASTSGAGY